MLLQTVYISSQNEIYSILPTNIAYFYIFCANCQNTREIRLKIILNSSFTGTIEISSFVGLFIAILKEQQGVIYKGGGIYNNFPQNVFLKGVLLRGYHQI